jgi:glutathione synthase/RimK-type ligase-like ATP-grasp enzyme
LRNNIILVHTANGRGYAEKIRRQIFRWDNTGNLHCNLFSVNNLEGISRFDPDRTLIHCRAAEPNSHWMQQLEEYNSLGFRFINSLQALRTTSDKAACAQLFIRPRTYIFERNNASRDLFNSLSVGEYVAKPKISQGQGIYIQRFIKENSSERSLETFRTILENIPTNTVVVQEFINYTRLHRIICVDGVAIPRDFYDTPTPTKWKVSVCLNPHIKVNRNPDPQLLREAESMQRRVGGNINFLDIFETRNGYVPCEINTACNLTRHSIIGGIHFTIVIAKCLIKHAKENV